MEIINYFYNCSKEYIASIDENLYSEISGLIKALPKRNTQADVNEDFFWLLTDMNWSYDSKPSQAKEEKDRSKLLLSNSSLLARTKRNNRDLCLTSTTLDVKWRCDFAKKYNNQLVQIEAQFGKTELMFKDFCGFRLGYFERRLALGIEIVFSEPQKYFAHRKKAISGMSNFRIAKETLLAINFDCPIWLIGLSE